MKTQPEDFPDLRNLQTHTPIITNDVNDMDWRAKLPTTDPNPAPAEMGVQSSTETGRERARPMMDTGQKRNPWIHDGNLKTKSPILKSDLALPNVQGRVEGDILCLEPSDYVPIQESWGYCLLGFMAGNFRDEMVLKDLSRRGHDQRELLFILTTGWCFASKPKPTWKALELKGIWLSSEHH